MNTIPALQIFTLVAVVLIAVGALLWFRRKPRNRHPMAGIPEDEQARMRASHRAGE